MMRPAPEIWHDLELCQAERAQLRRRLGELREDYTNHDRSVRVLRNQTRRWAGTVWGRQHGLDAIRHQNALDAVRAEAREIEREIRRVVDREHELLEEVSDTPAGRAS